MAILPLEGGGRAAQAATVGVAGGINGRSAGHPHPPLDASSSPLQGEDPLRRNAV
jgi:hypothetical protein